MAFTGFTINSIVFLRELAVHNNKSWFEQNRTGYERNLLEPLKDLVTGLGDTIRKIDNHIDTAPRTDRTISRIYRDIRFSSDKSPYRTDQWISFRRSKKVWGNVPEFYFYFTPTEYQYGMGFYAALPKNMQQIRDHIALHSGEFGRIINEYTSVKNLALKGEEYKKPIKNVLPAEFRSWYIKKSFYLSREKKIDALFYSENLQEEIKEVFRSCANLYRFIVEALYGNEENMN